MSRRKWHPVGQETEINTGSYRYVIGLYDHDKYGQACFRISKFLKSGYFVGHFVVVPEDQEAVLPAIAEAITEIWNKTQGGNTKEVRVT